MVFYALGLIYKEADTFKHYTNLMMYINIGCTCAAQIILSFIFAQMAEPIDIYESQVKEEMSEVTVERGEQLIHKWSMKNDGSQQAASGSKTNPTDY